MFDAKKFRGMLLGTAVCDALGVPVEFESRYTLKNRPVTQMQAFGTWRQPAGTWSDDTSLTVATIESMSRKNRIDYEDIAENFLRWYEKSAFTANGERFDVGNTTRASILRYARRLLHPVKCGATDENTNGNGSLMRILPVAMYLFAERGKISADELNIVHNMSALTHAHPISKISCGIFSLIAVKIFGGMTISDAFVAGIADAKTFYGDNDTFTNHFARLCDENFASLPENEIDSGGYVVETLEAALWCLLNTNNFRELALTAINLGGDTDTTGAVAGGLAGFVYGVDEIPAEWLDVLKRRAWIEKIADEFASLCENLQRKRGENF